MSGKKGNVGGMKKHSKLVLRDNEVSSKPGIVRLTKKGGSKKVSKEAITKLQSFMKNKLAYDLVKAAIIYMEHSRRQTIYAEDFIYAYEFVFREKYYGGKNPPSAPCENLSKTKTGKTREAISQIRGYQKQSNCLLLQKMPFRRCIKELAQEHRDEVRFSETAMLVIQDIIESYTVKIIDNSVTIMVTCGANILSHKHISTAIKIMGLNV